MSGIQGVTFGSNYIIPKEQFKDSATMKKLGMESAKYIKKEENMAMTPDGIVVKVDDAKDKEYEAVVAKYGVQIKKYEGKFPEKTLATTTPKDVNKVASATPKITPTGTPIVRYTDKAGEKFMAREVTVADTGYKCMAVSNVKNPSKVTLMSDDEYKKLTKEVTFEK